MFGFLNKNEEVNTKGIGLGLNVCKKITNMFGGDIICQSQEGQGSNFVFVVALGSQMEGCSGRKQKRILNPIQKTYHKIKLSDQLSMDPNALMVSGDANDIDFGLQLKIIQDENEASK